MTEKNLNLEEQRNVEINTSWYAYYKDIQPHLQYPDVSIYEMVEERNSERLDFIAYNYFGVKKTYMQLFAEIEKIAKSLKNIGINEGDAVTICMPNTPEGVVTFYAVNKIGAIVSMVHPLSAEKEINFYLNNSKSKLVVTVDLAYNKVKKAIEGTAVENIVVVSVSESMPKKLKIGYKITKGRKIPKIDKSKNILVWHEFIKLANNYGGMTKVHKRGNEPAVILYSGGTSGYPKGILLSNLNFNACALQSIEAVQCLGEKDKVLSIMPIFHGFGLGICINTVLNFGGEAIILPQFDAATFDKLLSKYKPNVIAGVPTLYEALINNKRMQKMDLSYIKCAISGGDSLSISLKEKLDEFFRTHGADIQIREGYGLTECVTGSCLTPKDFYREGSIGIPYPDTYYKIVKQGTEEVVPTGVVGEIVLSGPSVMIEYLDNEKETAETLKKHSDGMVWLHTGDNGYMDEDGFIYFKQRIKRVIVSSGYNIYPQKIENVIDAHPDVLMSCVVSEPHEYKREVAKAFVVLKKNIKPTEELKSELMELCRQSLAKYSWPYEFVFIEEMPKTLVGKIAYTKLQELGMN